MSQSSTAMFDKNQLFCGEAISTRCAEETKAAYHAYHKTINGAQTMTVSTLKPVTEACQGGCPIGRSALRS